MRDSNIFGKVKVANILNLQELPKNYFDIVLCVGSLPYIQKSLLSKAFSEIEGVLNSSGEGILVFQKETSFLVNLICKIISFIPVLIYTKVIVEICSFMLYPIFKRYFGRDLNKSYFKYGVLSSLHGINFGYPLYLTPWIIPWIDLWLISSKNVVVRISKKDLEKLESSQMNCI